MYTVGSMPLRTSRRAANTWTRISLACIAGTHTSRGCICIRHWVSAPLRRAGGHNSHIMSSGGLHISLGYQDVQIPRTYATAPPKDIIVYVLGSVPSKRATNTRARAFLAHIVSTYASQGRSCVRPGERAPSRRTR